jgi:hypothetical protein
MKSKLYPNKLILLLLLLLIIICIIVLLNKKFTNKEHFINSCTNAPVIKALKMGNTYTAGGNNTERNNAKDNDPTEIANKAFNKCIDKIYKDAASNKQLYTDNLDYLYKYAVEKGFLGSPTEQGNMEGCLNYCKLGVHYLFYLKNTPNYNTNKKTQIKNWLNKMYNLYGPTLGGRPNNQFVLYCLCGLINNELNNINSSGFSNKILKWMENEFKNGYIKCESNRGIRIIKYHYYTLGFVNSALLLMKFSNVSFNFKQIQDDYYKVVNNLTSPNVYKNFVTKFKEPKMLKGPSKTSHLNSVYEFIFNNKALPKLSVLTVLEITPQDLQIAVSPSSARPSSPQAVSSIPRTVSSSAGRTVSSMPRTVSSSARRTVSSSAGRTVSSIPRTVSSSAGRTVSSRSYSSR